MSEARNIIGKWVQNGPCTFKTLPRAANITLQVQMQLHALMLTTFACTIILLARGYMLYSATYGLDTNLDTKITATRRLIGP